MCLDCIVVQEVCFILSMLAGAANADSKPAAHWLARWVNARKT